MHTRHRRVNFEIRKATEADTPLIAWFIRQLAEYERLLEETTMTEETLRESLFGPRSSTEVLLGYYEERPVAFAVFFHNFSTFVGKRGLYLEDLFVIPEMRGKGFGRALLVHLSKIARERNCGRDRKSTRLNSSHGYISYAVFCLKKKKHSMQTIVTERIRYLRRYTTSEY